MNHTQVLAFINPDFWALKPSIFVKISVKHSSSPQTLLRKDIDQFWKISDLGSSFSGKALWQGCFNLLLRNEDIGSVRSKMS